MMTIPAHINGKTVLLDEAIEIPANAKVYVLIRDEGNDKRILPERITLGGVEFVVQPEGEGCLVFHPQFHSLCTYGDTIETAVARLMGVLPELRNVYNEPDDVLTNDAREFRDFLFTFSL
jgi:hypothetical protein